MKLYYFSEMPHHEYPDEEGDKYPSLIVWGREDQIVPVACAEQYRKRLPNATLHVFDKCGHLPPIEQPDAFARLVVEFLGGGARR